MSSKKIRDFLNKSNTANSNNVNTSNNSNNTIEKKYLKSESGNLQVEIPASRSVISEHLVIKEFSKKPEDLLYKSIMFYGASGSGKTRLIHHFMYEMRHLFPRVFIFCPTNSETNDYSKIIPEPMIFENFTIENIRNIFQCQKALSSAYQIANDLSILKPIFDKVADITHKQYMGELYRQKKIALQAASDADKDIIKSTFNKKAVEFIKTHVLQPNKNKLLEMELPDTEIMAVRNLKTNPNVLIVFDDAITELSDIIAKGNKTNNRVIHEFFFRARHSFITHFYSMQDDKGFPSELRKNSFINFYTKSEIANATFLRGANNYDKQTIARATNVANEIFKYQNDPKADTKKKYRKMIYYRETGEFEYITATIHNNFRMCSKYVWSFCKKIQKDPLEIDKSNPFLKKFIK